MWHLMRTDKSSYYMFKESDCRLWLCTGCLLMCQERREFRHERTLTLRVTTRGQSSFKNLSRPTSPSVASELLEMKKEDIWQIIYSLQCKLLISVCNYMCITNKSWIKSIFAAGTIQCFLLSETSTMPQMLNTFNWLTVYFLEFT